MEKLLVIAKEESCRWHLARAIELASNSSLHGECQRAVIHEAVIGEVPLGVEVETGPGLWATSLGDFRFTTVRSLRFLPIWSLNLKSFPPNTKVVIF